MDETSIVTLMPGVLTAHVDGDIVALSGGAYYDTAGVGAVIWRQIATPTRVGDLVHTLVARYDVSPVDCLADVLSFLEQAQQAGLIRVETEAPAD